MTRPKFLWFDETFFLDHNGSAANVWLLAPEKVLRVGNGERVSLLFDVTAAGTPLTAPDITLAVEQAAAATDVDAAFTLVDSSTDVIRGQKPIAFTFGADGGESKWVAGVLRVKVTRGDATGTAWVAIHLRAWAEVEEPGVA